MNAFEAITHIEKETEIYNATIGFPMNAGIPRNNKGENFMPYKPSINVKSIFLPHHAELWHCSPSTDPGYFYVADKRPFRTQGFLELKEIADGQNKWTVKIQGLAVTISGDMSAFEEAVKRYTKKALGGIEFIFPTPDELTDSELYNKAIHPENSILAESVSGFKRIRLFLKKTTEVDHTSSKRVCLDTAVAGCGAVKEVDESLPRTGSVCTFYSMNSTGSEKETDYTAS